MMRRCRDVFRKVEGDPLTQYRIHRFMGRFWVIMTPVAIAVCILAPAIWLKVSIIYVVIISHYANWSTDSGAMAAANASTDEVITAYEVGREDQG